MNIPAGSVHDLATATAGRRPVVDIVDADTLDAARELTRVGHRPLVLIFADDVTPGGCVEAAAGMQEESLFRRTNLCAALGHPRQIRPRHYPIGAREAVYVPHALVLRDSEQHYYEPLKTPIPMAFIACPGIKMPSLTSDGLLLPTDVALLQDKFVLILQTALKNGHDSVVLGALGCGVWGCPPRHVAQIMKQVIAIHGFGLTRIVVAVLGGATLHTFRDAFASGSHGPSSSSTD